MAPVSKKQKISNKYVLDLSAPVNDNIIDVSAFEKFLNERIKVDNRTGNMGDEIAVEAQKSKIIVVAHTKFSGRYLKYLTKKFLKKNNLRDWIRVVSTSKRNYQLRFYNVVVSDNEEEED